MPAHPEHERTRGAPDDEAENPAPASTGLRAQLTKFAHYLVQGFAPAVAVVALAVAVVAVADKRSGESRLNEVSAELQGVNANLAAVRSELENLKFVLPRQKAQPDAERKQEELNDRIVQNVTRLQEKMKVSPTLEEQLHRSAGAPVAEPAASTSPAVPEKAPATVATPAAPGKTAAKAPEKKPTPKAAAPATPENKSGKQLQGIKDAIEKFNNK